MEIFHMSIGHTQAEKRAIEESNPSSITRFVKVINHYFPEWNKMLGRITDPRDLNRITYPMEVLLNTIILKDVTGVVTMQQMKERFNHTKSVHSLGYISGVNDLKSVPDWQTINNVLEEVEPQQLENFLQDLITKLIRGKKFNQNRVEKAWPVILDGTGYAYFRKRHCEQDLVCNVKDENGKVIGKRYYHKALVAKLLLSPNLTLTLGVEFIENENENVSKQDCEIRAAKRLMKRLHERFPRLHLIILGDALYGVETMMAECKSHHWDYLFNQKDTRQQIICRDFYNLSEADRGTAHVRCRKDQGTVIYRNGMEKISGKEQIFNVLQYTREAQLNGDPIPAVESESSDDEEDQNVEPTKFMWVTNLDITEQNVQELTRLGRNRWRIENEGFNAQKRGVFKLEHLCSRNPNGMKIHFLLTQIADLLWQLFLAYDWVINECGTSLKCLAEDLLRDFQVIDVSLDAEVIMANTHLFCQKRR